MVAGISKRQQFRNERALQDLIRSVPGNDRCADCQALNPGELCRRTSSTLFRVLMDCFLWYRMG